MQIKTRRAINLISLHNPEVKGIYDSASPRDSNHHVSPCLANSALQRRIPYQAWVVFIGDITKDRNQEPVGGAARFVSLLNDFRDKRKYPDGPDLVTFFSGDAFNPSIESSITKVFWKPNGGNFRVVIWFRFSVTP